MIRRLQRQFVAIAMISLLFIIVAIVGAINGFNLRQINSTADAILELLARNGGVFPDADSSGLVSSPDSDLVLTRRPFRDALFCGLYQGRWRDQRRAY